MKEKFDEIINVITNKLPKTQAIYLFGSQANGLVNANSDVDLAVLLPYDESKGLELLFFEIKAELDQLLKVNVDLVNLREASVVFSKEVLNNSKLIYCSDTQAKDSYEMYSMSLYQKLNDERKYILRDMGVNYG